MVWPVRLNCKAECLETVHHYPGIVAVKHSGQLASAFRERGTDDCPVGDTF